MTGSTFSKELSDRLSQSADSLTKMDEESNIMIQFHNQLQQLYLNLYPTPTEWCMRVASFQRLRQIILSLDSRLKVEIYGSTSQQLYLPTSDLDVAVECAFGYPDLSVLADMLRGYGYYESVTVIGKSAYPILKLIETGTNLNIDIGFNVRHSMSAVTWVKQARTVLLYLEPLVMVIKHFLHHRSLNIPYDGGLTSYALIIMVAHFLKRFDMDELEESVQSAPMGVMFLKFLEFYGESFEFMKYGLVITPDFEAQLVEKERLAIDNLVFPSTLTIIDPVNSENNVGSGAHNFVYIRTSFCIALSTIRLFLNSDLRHTNMDRILQTIIPVTRADQLIRKRATRSFQTAFTHPYLPMFVPPYSPYVNPYECQSFSLLSR